MQLFFIIELFKYNNYLNKYVILRHLNRMTNICIHILKVFNVQLTNIITDVKKEIEHEIKEVNTVSYK